MPRVTFVKKAQKDNSAVKAGESYYWWKFPYGPKRYSRSKPRQSQLTQSDKLSRVYAAQESVEDLDIPDPANYETPELLADDVEGLAETWRNAAEELREIANEYTEGADNQEEYFPGSSQAEESRDKASSLESDADTADSNADDIENYASNIRAIEVPEVEVEEPEEGVEQTEEQKAAALEAAKEEAADAWRAEAQSEIDQIPTDLEVSI